MITIYTILHFLVDGICAMAMFSSFIKGDIGLLYILIYNLCAFALQMPLGACMSMLPGRRKHDKDKNCMYVAMLGTLLTIVGSFTHPALLGLGNALFHVGGGTAAIHEDRLHHRKGKLLGIFVAPGALGIYFGTILHATEDADLLMLAFRLIAIFLCLGLFYIWYYHDEERKVQTKLKLFDPIQIRKPGADGKADKKPAFRTYTTQEVVIACVVCLVAATLRSFIGFSVSYSWETTEILTLASVACVCIGKVAGGFLADKVGFFSGLLISFGGAAVCFVFSDVLVCGLLAQLLLNLSMAMVLAMLADRLYGKEGFAFGLLSFGIFLGFLPSFFGVQLPIAGSLLGAICSVVAFVLLLPLFAKEKTEEATDAK